MSRGAGWLAAARWVVIATVVGVVLAFHPRAADAFGLTKTLVLGIGTVLAVACVTLWKVESEEPFPRFSALPWLSAFVGAVALATAFSRVPGLSLLGAYTRYNGLLTVVLLALLTAAVAVAFAFAPEWRERVLLAIVGSAAVVAVYAVFQRLGVDAFDFRDVTGLKPDFPGSTVGNSLFAGSICGMALPVAAALAWRGKRLGLLGIVVLTVGLWATSSRSGMLGAVAGLAALGLLTPGRWRRVLVRGGAVTIAVLIVVVVVDRDVLRTESLTIRGGEWSAATHVWLSRPLVGTGPDTFANESPRYRTRADAQRFGLRIADKPHNLYLEYLSSTGVIGLAAFAAFVGSIATNALRVRRDENAAAFVAVGVSYLVAAAFSFDTPATTPLAFVAAGLLMAMSAAPGRPGPERMRYRPGNRTVARVDASPWFTRAFVGFVVAAVLTFAVRPMRADLAAAQAQRAQGSAATLAVASHDFDRAISLNPLASTYRAEAGELAMRWASHLEPNRQKTAWRVAVARYQQAVDAEPRNILFGLGLARAQSSYALVAADAAVFADSTATWHRLVEADPYDWQLRNEHALSLNTWANALPSVRYRRAAVAELRRVVAIKPDYVSAWVNIARLSIALGDERSATDAARRALALHPSDDVLDELRSLAR